jgi:thiosulfate/3-mercaptopyruvate sulfurtransferase
MPNALNVPFASLLREDDMTKFKSMDRVKQIFIEAGIKPYEECTDNEKKVVCSCGSGVTAATLAIGLEECGLRKREDIYIYDGSWIEWGGDTTTPIIKDVSV